MWSAATVLVCAIGLLGRSPETLPPIVLLDAPPAGVSANAEGFVRSGASPIHLVTSSEAFRAAQASDIRCGSLDALRRIASVVIHEEWHVRNGPDERGAYLAQLMALAVMGARQGTPLYRDVFRSMRAVTTGGRDARRAASAPPPATRLLARR